MLWARWIDLWNGDLAQAEEIIHPEFALHRIPPPEVFGQAGGRDGLLAWIRQTRSLFEDLRLTVEVGPIVAGEMVAGRWLAEGAYQGGIPGSSAPAGTRVRFHGNDIWRAEGGLIREYWLSDDLLDLMHQLGAIPAS
jgi:predicted ester cyclase